MIRRHIDITLMMVKYKNRNAETLANKSTINKIIL